MSIHLFCPSGHRLTVPEGSVGRLIRCARCKKTVIVPDPAATTSPSAPAATTNEAPSDAPTPAPAADAEKRVEEPPPPPPTAPLPPAVPIGGLVETEEPSSKSKTRRRDKNASRHAGRRDRKRPKRDDDAARPQRPSQRAATGRRKPLAETTIRSSRIMPANVYRPDAGKIANIRWLAAILGLTVLFSLAPVFYKMHFDVQVAPGWARLVLLLAVLQAVYIAWMLGAPDWVSVWVVMLVFAAVAALYGTATAMAITAPVDRPMLLGMDEVRRPARAWCGSVMLVMSLATYLCGRLSARWRRAVELETASRSGPRGLGNDTMHLR
jgi:hypothetical protein